TIYAYDARGKLASEYGSTTTPSCTSCYLTPDPLGSTRLITDASGAVTARSDYLPFGEEVPADRDGRSTVTCGGASCFNEQGRSVAQKFTGKERDAETGLDYFGARYLSSTQGRFTSPDPLFFQKEMLEDPQRWNLYSYVRNNPL